MWCTRIVKCSFLLLASATCMFAQSSETAPATTAAEQPAAQTVQAHRRTHPVLCWREAGIAPSMVNERWKIEDQGKGRIAAVCNDPALSAEKRREKIQEINVETDQEVARLIPTKQLQAFRACQAEQDKLRPKPAGQKELGPCGGVIPAEPATADVHPHSQPAN